MRERSGTSPAGKSGELGSTRKAARSRQCPEIQTSCDGARFNRSSFCILSFALLRTGIRAVGIRPLLITMIDVVRKAVARVPVQKFSSLDLVLCVFDNDAAGTGADEALHSFHLQRPTFERCPVVLP